MPENGVPPPARWPEADLTVIRWGLAESRRWAEEWRRHFPEAPLALSAAQFSADDLRVGINQLWSLGFMTDARLASELPAAAEKAAERRRQRGARDRTLQNFGRRNRELERLTEILEKTVVERTSNLEASTREEKEKLARERQLIRFLNEISLQRSTGDILRVVRRELRRFHKIQNLVVALRDTDQRTEFMSFRGDQILRHEGSDKWPGKEADDRERQQLFANHFGRPFHRTLFFPLDLHSAGEGLLAVEYSLMGEEEIGLITDLLNERLRPVGMAVERLFLEDRLRRFAGRWERTFDGFRDPIAVIDSRMKVLRGNRAFGAGPGRRSCHELFAGSDKPCEACPVSVQPESAQTLQGTVRIDRRVYRLSSWPVQEPRAVRISGRVTHYTDITESRELYLRMLQSEKMSAIGSLAGNIAHELNNPLTGIRSLAQVLEAEATDEGTLKEDLHQIENAARRCQTIIRHLLDFTRGGEGPIVPVSLDEVVESTLPLLKTVLRPHRLELLLTARNAKIMAEPHLLQQAVFNLINNACQAMKDTGRIGVASKVTTDNEVELRIIDTGPGIPEEIRGRLFEPFFTTKKEGDGTGLGLSTSRAIVEKYGGRIEFNSVLGQGTEFILRFPRREGP
ncbi:MAG: PAS domain-containing sensor histidine kinase [Bdellovibrionaceae bacterium]|nr:PAS domain-containing sensor histidine kinase [Pseudobdellovibrionaceae bacterium]MBX3032843.1 PAS domain-containing sensor histidine kinase [Pseudobdellovibrionaceae bacterium]